MKQTVIIPTSLSLLLFISCGRSNSDKGVVNNYQDTAKKFVEKKEVVGNGKRFEEQNEIGSVNDDEALSQALKIAEQHQAKKRFKQSYVAATDDGSYQVNVDMDCNFFFTRQFPHLIIRRSTPSSIYIDIFAWNDNKFRKVLWHEQGTLDYTGNTIRDINGDGLKDFVVDWYGSTGCCLKAFSNVYLLRSDAKSFSNSFEFINPTFSPKEQIVRGVCYGHPGETAMYKYKWSKEAVDTVEYIYYEKNEKGVKTRKLIVSNNFPYSPNHKILRRLKDIPAEYKKIEGYDWFTGNLNRNGNR
jgi:hypothetical protein